MRERQDVPYTYFYDRIIGFDYVPGNRYMLQIVQRKVENPPQDGSSFEYRLIFVLSKTPASP